MSINLDVATRDAKLDAVESAIGAAPTLTIFSGAQPAACSDADPSGPLATMTLPSDWMANASGGTKAMTGSWPTPTATGTGTAQSFRVYDSGSACRMQGTVGTGSGDLALTNASITSGQVVTVTAFTWTEGNA